MSPTASPPASTQMPPLRRSAREILLEQLSKPNMRSIGSQYPLRCVHCGMTFIHHIHLTAHIRMHQAPYSSVQCPECDVTCTDDLSLQDHLDEVHSPGRAFAVKFSIAERIAYGHPESPTSSDGSPSRHVVAPYNMIPISQEPLPNDYAYQMVFAQRPTCNKTTHVRPSSVTSSSSMSSMSSRPPAKRVCLPSSSPLKQQLTQGSSSTSSSTTSIKHHCCSESRRNGAVVDKRSSILQRLLTSSTDPTSPALPSMPKIVVDPSANNTNQERYSPSQAERASKCHGHAEDSPTKDVACEHCDKRFMYKCNLARHLSAIHNERTLKSEEPSLGKSPRSPFKVGPIETIPTEKKEAVVLKCDFCDRLFSQRSSLVLHQQVHQGPEPYRCSICHGVRFRTRQEMEAHMERHRLRALKRAHRQRRQLHSALGNSDSSTSCSDESGLIDVCNSSTEES